MQTTQWDGINGAKRAEIRNSFNATSTKLIKADEVVGKLEQKLIKAEEVVRKLEEKLVELEAEYKAVPTFNGFTTVETPDGSQ